jgi:type III pantothenate kinase
MNLVVDVGNSRIKVGVFEDNILMIKQAFSENSELKKFLEESALDNIIVSTVNTPANEILSWSRSSGKKISLTPELALPIKIKYKTLATLGVDRIAAVCGALELFPEQNCLVIDAGTCINYEFLDSQGTYKGGAISPGISMRLEAMHKFTAKLPLIKIENAHNLIGDDTESCMQSGVALGVLNEVKGFINEYQSLFKDLKVIICGGDYPFFEKNLKEAIFVAPDLVLSGLNRILRYHVEKF